MSYDSQHVGGVKKTEYWKVDWGKIGFVTTSLAPSHRGIGGYTLKET